MCCHNIFFLSSYMHLQNEAFAITNNQKTVCKIHGVLPKSKASCVELRTSRASSRPSEPAQNVTISTAVIFNLWSHSAISPALACLSQQCPSCLSFTSKTKPKSNNNTLWVLSSYYGPLYKNISTWNNNAMVFYDIRPICEWIK